MGPKQRCRTLNAAIYRWLDHHLGDFHPKAMLKLVAADAAREVEAALVAAADDAPEYNPGSKAGLIRRNRRTSGST